MAVFERDDWWHKASWPRIAPSTRGDGRRPCRMAPRWLRACSLRGTKAEYRHRPGEHRGRVRSLYFLRRRSGYGRGRSPHAFDRYAQPTAWFRLRWEPL